MNTNMLKQVAIMTEAMEMCEADLRTRHDEATISLAKCGIAAMIHTVGENIITQSPDQQPRVDFGNTMCVALEMLRTLDRASDYAANVVNKKN